MPHLVLEYSANLAGRSPSEALLVALHRVLESAAGIRIGNCKSRWREVEHWAVGEGGAASAFVHLDISFLEGRTPRVKHAVGTAALALLKEHFSPVPDGLDLQITVQLREIGRAAYFKHPPGTLAHPELKHV